MSALAGAAAFLQSSRRALHLPSACAGCTRLLQALRTSLLRLNTALSAQQLSAMGVVKLAKPSEAERNACKKNKVKKAAKCQLPRKVPFKPCTSLPDPSVAQLGFVQHCRLDSENASLRNLRLQLLCLAGAPFAVLSITELVMRHMSEPTLEPKLHSGSSNSTVVGDCWALLVSLCLFGFCVSFVCLFGLFSEHVERCLQQALVCLDTLKRNLKATITVWLYGGFLSTGGCWINSGRVQLLLRTHWRE